MNFSKTLGKGERLKSRKSFETLFREGKGFRCYPFLVKYRLVPRSSQASPVLFGVSVPKRVFPSAVKRNLVKRRIREAYRLNKHILYSAFLPGPHLIELLVIYQEKEVLDYPLIEKGIIKALNQLVSGQ